MDEDPKQTDGGSEPEDEGSGKPTIDEPTAPALDPEEDEFDKQAEGAGGA